MISDLRCSKLARVLLSIALVAITSLVLAACGSSSTSTTGGSETQAGGSTSTAGSESESSGVDPTKVYAPGVPTLEELYAGTATAPPKTGPEAKPGVEVIWVSCGQEAPGCAEPAADFAEAAKALGWKYRIIDGKLNVGGRWTNAIREAIAAHPSAIITHGMSCEEVKQPLTEAKAAGIPLVEVEEIDCDQPMYDVNNYFSEDAKESRQFFERFGENGANYVIDATEGKAKVILIEYGGLFGKYLAEGSKRQLAKCAECEIVTTVPYQANEQAPNGPLFQRFSTTLVKYPEANSVIFNNDAVITVAGLGKAVADAGRAGDMIVGGGEGYAEVLQLIEEEKGVTGEPASKDTGWALAWGVADGINRYLSGEPTVPEGGGFQLVTKGHNMPPAGQNYETSVDYKAAYEKVWSGK